MALTYFNIFWGISSTIYVYTYYICMYVYIYIYDDFIWWNLVDIHQQKIKTLSSGWFWGISPTEMGRFTNQNGDTMGHIEPDTFLDHPKSVFFLTFLVSDHLLLKTSLFCAKRPKRAKRPKPHVLHQGVSVPDTWHDAMAELDANLLANGIMWGKLSKPMLPKAINRYQ